MFTKNDTKIMKALAIFLMLYHHLFTFQDRINYEYISLLTFNGKTSAYFLGDFGKLCVGIFVFLSGYGTYIAFKNNSKNLIKKKLISLYKSFWKVFFIVIPISLILHTINFDIKEFISNLTAWNTTYNGEWWFMSAFVALTILSPILIKIINKYCKKISISFILLLIINCIVIFGYPKLITLSFIQPIQYTTIFSIFTNTICLLPTYICGILFSKFKLLDKIKSKYKNNYKYSVFSIIILLIIFILRRKFWYYNYEFIYTPLFIISTSIILSLSIFNKVNNILEQIGNQSTNIWLTHSFFCYKWCQKFIFLPKFSVLIFLLLLIVSYTFSLLIDLIYKNLNKIKTQLLVRVSS